MLLVVLVLTFFLRRVEDEVLAFDFVVLEEDFKEETLLRDPPGERGSLEMLIFDFDFVDREDVGRRFGFGELIVVAVVGLRGWRSRRLSELSAFEF